MLTKIGSTPETSAIATQLRYSKGSRLELVRLLTELDKPTAYSQQDVDRQSHLAQRLADFARVGNPNIIVDK